MRVASASNTCRAVAGERNRYECFFDAFGDVRTLSLPNYDNWPLINKHSKCLEHSLKVLNDMIMAMITEHEQQLDLHGTTRSEARPSRHTQELPADALGRFSATPPPPVHADVQPPDAPLPGHGTHDQLDGGKANSRMSTETMGVTRQVEFDRTPLAPTPGVTEQETPGYEKTNLLHRMVAAIRDARERGEEDPLTREDLRANLVMFFIAGHDTTSTAMSWAVHYLANYRDVQERLREEIMAKGPWARGECAVGGGLLSESESDAPAYEHLSPGNMPYLDAFIKEVMRLRPPVGNVWTRKAAADTLVGGYLIRKGTLVSPSIYNVHHDPHVWQNPDEFDPDR